MSQIIAKTAYLQAKFLEPFVPSMARRGRLQAGAFADITIFDPDSVKGCLLYTSDAADDEYNV